MALTTIKGIVRDVNPIEYYGEDNKGRRQTVVIFIPGYTDNHGVKMGRDEVWGIDIFNAKIDEFNLNSNCLNKRAELEIYLSGKEFDKKDGAGKWYGISANLKSIKLGDSVPISNESNNDNDLPF